MQINRAAVRAFARRTRFAGGGDQFKFCRVVRLFHYATVKKIFTDYDDEKINDLCAKHKSDPKKQNVACNNNSIAFSFNDDFSGYDLRNLGGMYFQTDCNFAMAFLRGICNSNYMNEQNRPNIIDELE